MILPDKDLLVKKAWYASHHPDGSIHTVYYVNVHEHHLQPIPEGGDIVMLDEAPKNPIDFCVNYKIVAGKPVFAPKQKAPPDIDKLRKYAIHYVSYWANHAVVEIEHSGVVPASIALTMAQMDPNDEDAAEAAKLYIAIFKERELAINSLKLAKDEEEIAKIKSSLTFEHHSNS